jgi:tRNA(fMet)-specific endonuclease VapC
VRKVLLDTNAYTGFLTGDEKVLDTIASAEVVYLSIIVVGELFTGFKGGSRFLENLRILRNFYEKPTVSILNATMETAEIFGTLKNALKKAGTPLPINDVWIAAHTLETGSVLISYDHHFSIVPGLRLWEHL